MNQIVTERADDVEQKGESDVEVAAAPEVSAAIEQVLEDELVEDVSIDGMCGVY